MGATGGVRRRIRGGMPAQPFDVDLGGGGENVHAFAWADESSLRAAARDDFAALLVPDTRKRVFALHSTSSGPRAARAHCSTTPSS